MTRATIAAVVAAVAVAAAKVNPSSVAEAAARAAPRTAITDLGSATLTAATTMTTHIKTANLDSVLTH
jgi:hypothetical protein